MAETSAAFGPSVLILVVTVRQVDDLDARVRGPPLTLAAFSGHLDTALILILDLLVALAFFLLDPRLVLKLLALNSHELTHLLHRKRVRVALFEWHRGGAPWDDAFDLQVSVRAVFERERCDRIRTPRKLDACKIEGYDWSSFGQPVNGLEMLTWELEIDNVRRSAGDGAAFEGLLRHTVCVDRRLKFCPPPVPVPGLSNTEQFDTDLSKLRELLLQACLRLRVICKSLASFLGILTLARTSDKFRKGELPMSPLPVHTRVDSGDLE